MNNPLRSPGASLLAFIALLGFAMGAQAHNRSQSFSHWQWDAQQLEMVFTVKAREVTRLPPVENNLTSLNELLATHLQRTLLVAAGEQPCEAAGKPEVQTGEPGYLTAKWSFSCPTEQGLRLEIHSFFPVAASHVHYANVAKQPGNSQQYLFTESRRSHAIGVSDNPVDSLYRAFAQYITLGMEHIFLGVDHIVFLLALMLLLRSLKELIWMVTGFTVGHSITLGLATLGIVNPEASVVEALIGFTIALVALENIVAGHRSSQVTSYWLAAGLVLLGVVSLGWGRGLPLLTTLGLTMFVLAHLPLCENKHTAIKLRPALTLGFGLIHGFGFAGVLSEVGLPQQHLVPALAGFNIGVEIGQLLIVSALWGLRYWLKQVASLSVTEMAPQMLSAILVGTGCYWFVARSFSLV
ncbi:HupE/UreJ family protein [Pseudomaricurvus alkylphenolicus]|uniref:HupE/UreJ family protein n=1 Tax=Pseudomaricurvus alkylphenolicus TaxID=1306991 RepID=UPI00141F9455|nr:HupE/UreJ family protein [Pseudomaricurvus alkylphenolicus]NIB38606.1 HupE/UreJ family protein [Pseudomaricurvus alkylphenolicus]